MYSYICNQIVLTVKMYHCMYYLVYSLTLGLIKHMFQSDSSSSLQGTTTIRFTHNEIITRKSY